MQVVHGIGIGKIMLNQVVQSQVYRFSDLSIELEEASGGWPNTRNAARL